MSMQYLLDPQLQISDKSGALNVAGFLRVYLNGTDDLAVTYKDFNGTLNTADIVLDDNGRAVVIADSSKAYRLEVYNRLGGLMWTQYPLNTIAGGAGGADGVVVESTDGSIQVDKYNAGGLVHFDLSTEGAQELEWTRTDNALIEESAEGVFLLPVNQVEGNMTVDCTGILLKANVHYDVSMFINIEAPSTVVNRFEGLQFRVGGPDAPVAAVTFDNSYAHRQVACLSCDVHPQADTRLRVYVEGLANGAVLSCSQCTVHSLAASYTSGGGGETYTAGSGISISEQNVISVDQTIIQPKLTAGTGITIQDNVISSTGGSGGDVVICHYTDSERDIWNAANNGLEANKPVYLFGFTSNDSIDTVSFPLVLVSKDVYVTTSGNETTTNTEMSFSQANALAREGKQARILGFKYIKQSTYDGTVTVNRYIRERIDTTILPWCNSADAGKVLSVAYNGDVEWVSHTFNNYEFSLQYDSTNGVFSTNRDAPFAPWFSPIAFAIELSHDDGEGDLTSGNTPSTSQFNLWVKNTDETDTLLHSAAEQAFTGTILAYPFYNHHDNHTYTRGCTTVIIYSRNANNLKVWLPDVSPSYLADVTLTYRSLKMV